MTTTKRTLSFSKRGFSPETMMWIFTRLSALAMYALMLAGVVGALIVSAQTHTNLANVLRWAFFANSSPNPLSGMPWIAVFAKLMVMAFMLVVSSHGVHGIVEVWDDYMRNRFPRRIFLNIIIVIFAVSNLVVAYVLFFAAK